MLYSCDTTKGSLIAAQFQSCGIQKDDLLLIKRKAPSLLDTPAPFVVREGMQLYEIPVSKSK